MPNGVRLARLEPFMEVIKTLKNVMKKIMIFNGLCMFKFRCRKIAPRCRSDHAPIASAASFSLGGLLLTSYHYTFFQQSKFSKKHAFFERFF